MVNLSPSSALAALILTAAATVVTAQGERGFLCEKTVWKAPSKSNDIATCLASPDHLPTYLADGARVVPMLVGLLCIVTAVFIIFIYPLFLCGRYICGCCGGKESSPGAGCCPGSEWKERTELERRAGYTSFEIRCAKACAIIVALFSISAVVLTIIGSSITIGAYDEVFVNARKVLDWTTGKKDEIRTEMTVPNAVNVLVLVPPLTDLTFSDMQSKIDKYTGQLNGLQQQFAPYISNANIGSLIIATVPMVFIVFTVLAAIFNMRSVVLLINSVFHWILIIAYGALGGIFLIVSVFVVDLAAERQKLLDDKPGLFKYSLVPQFNSEAPFDNMRVQVEAGEVDNSKAACRDIATICTPTGTVFSIATPDRIFSCPGLNNPETDCSNLGLVEAVVGNIRLLSGSPIFCTNLTADVQATQCTMAICAKTCQESTPKNTSNSAVTNLRFARASKSAFDKAVRPILDFQVIFTEMMNRVTVLPTLATSLSVAGAGLCLFCIFFTWNLFVIFRGQKRFFPLDNSDLEPAPAAPAPANEPTDASKQV